MSTFLQLLFLLFLFGTRLSNSVSLTMLPLSGDSLALWECGGIQPERQVFNYSTQIGLLENHIIVHGTEQSNPPIVWDIAGPSNETGTLIHVWGSYSSYYPSQQWIFKNTQITSVYNNMCVGVDKINGPSIGSLVGIYPCNSTDSLQQWSFNLNSGLISLLSSKSTLCIQAGNNTPSCDIPPFSLYPYCNPTMPLSTRLADLISRMSPADMARAMDASIPAIPRLGIPSMGSGEALHGAATGCLTVPESNGTGCPTSFPCPMALAASFDSNLWSEIGLAIGLESRALYNAGAGAIWLFAPNINPCREPRWGRCQEVPGEDPLVVSHYATQFINGLQGLNGPDPNYLLCASTAKHFISYDIEGYIPRTDIQPRPPTARCDTPGGCQRWNFDASPRLADLNGYYLPPFIAAINAGVRSIMCAYSGIFGQPSCASDLIQSILRSNTSTLWDGHIVSDATAIELMGDSKWDNCQPPFPPVTCIPDPFNSHNYTFTVGETALAALNAGVDVNLGPFYHMWLEALVNNGTVSLSTLEMSVTRIYTSAIKLGLLDPKQGQMYPNLPPSTVDSIEHRALALRAAQESIVLLSNSLLLLPLKLQSTSRIAFIGPHANSTQAFLSNYHGENRLVNSHSPLQVALSRGYNVSYERGCNICDEIPSGFPNMPCTKAMDTSGIASASALAASVDIVVLFLGADQTSEAENFDRSDIGLLGVQEQLAQAIIAVQPKTIVILISGGIICSPWIVQNAPALLYSFYPGELGGDAILDILTGVVNPSGKLPVTMYYANITTIRDIRDMDLSSNGGITHSYYNGPVLYPFGSGLSYTSWKYQLKEEKEEEEMLPLIVKSDELIQLQFSIFVQNVGDIQGDCVILAFVERMEYEEDDNRTKEQDIIIGPRRSLFGFKKLYQVKSKEERLVKFDLDSIMKTSNALGVFDEYERKMWIPRKGIYSLQFGDVVNPIKRVLQVV